MIFKHRNKNNHRPLDKLHGPWGGTQTPLWDNNPSPHTILQNVLGLFETAAIESPYLIEKKEKLCKDSALIL